MIILQGMSSALHAMISNFPGVIGFYAPWTPCSYPSGDLASGVAPHVDCHFFLQKTPLTLGIVESLMVLGIPQNPFSLEGSPNLQGQQGPVPLSLQELDLSLFFRGSHRFLLLVFPDSLFLAPLL